MPPAVNTATESRPLSDEEKKVLRDLMARDGAFAAPAARFGEPYEALTNLSVPRRDNTKESRESDLVYRGETVYLTEEEAAQFNRRGRRDGRQVDVVRKLSGPDGSREAAPRILPKHLSGRLFRPMTPPPGSDLERPDPEGSSHIQVMQAEAPEASGAATADTDELANQFSAAANPDAVDIAPRGRGRRAGNG